MSGFELADITTSADRFEIFRKVRAASTNWGLMINVRRILIAVNAGSTFRFKSKPTHLAPLGASIKAVHNFGSESYLDGLTVKANIGASMPDDQPVVTRNAVSNIPSDARNVAMVVRFDRLKYLAGDWLFAGIAHKLTGNITLLVDKIQETKSKLSTGVIQLRFILLLIFNIEGRIKP